MPSFPGAVGTSGVSETRAAAVFAQVAAQAGDTKPALLCWCVEVIRDVLTPAHSSIPPDVMVELKLALSGATAV